MLITHKATASVETCRYRILRVFHPWLTILVFGLLLGAVSTATPADEKVLFEDNFTGIGTKWKVWDDPSAEHRPSQWRAGLAELSGVENKENKIATALLAGDPSWRDYTIETSLFKQGYSGKGEYFSLLFGYRGPERFYHIGYDFKEERFEFEARTENGFEEIAHCTVYLPDGGEVGIRLDFVSGRIRLKVQEQVIFDVVDTRYTNGQFGVAASRMGSGHALLGPLVVTATDPADLPPVGLQDLLARMRGAKLLESTSEDFASIMDHFIWLKDAEPPSPWVWSGYRHYFSDQRQGEAVFAFPGERLSEIQQMELHDLWTEVPSVLEILVSRDSPKQGFHLVGHFKLQPDGEKQRKLVIEPLEARYVKVRLRSEAEKGRLNIGELYVYGRAGKEQIATAITETVPSAVAGTILFKEDFSGPDLSQWQQWDDPSAGQPGLWSAGISEFSGIQGRLGKTATMLLTGKASWTNYAIEAELFANRGDGRLTGIVFGYQGNEHYYHVGYNHYRDRYELELRTPAGFRLLAFAETLFPFGGWIPVRLDFSGGRILFRVKEKIIFDVDDRRFSSGKVGIDTDSLGNGNVFARNFRVLDSSPEALPKRELTDLLSARRGAAVIYRETLPAGDWFSNFIDHPVIAADGGGHDYSVDIDTVSRPEEVVFCFPQGRTAEIHRIGVQLSDREFPKELKFWVSDQTPKSGFRLLKTIQLRPEADSYQEFEVSPTSAKYLKMQITSGHKQRLTIREIWVKGYFRELDPQAGEEDALGGVDIVEKESNDTTEQANPVSYDLYIGGDVADGDIDYYRLAPSSSRNLLRIDLNHIGPVAPRGELLDGDGRVLVADNRITAGRVTSLTYRLEPHDYLFRVTRPPTYLTIVYDDSGSMGDSVPLVKRVLRGYLNNLGTGLQIKLMKYADAPVVLSSFTRDPAALAAAIDKEVGGGGGTETFKGLSAAIDSVEEQDGNRGVLALLDHFDGDLRVENYIQLWDDVLDSNINFSTIGVGSGWEYEKPFFGNTREQVFRELAYSTQGQFFHAPTDEQVRRSAEVLLTQLTGPAKYRFKAGWERKVRKPGTLHVLFRAGENAQAVQNLEIILDASNSMWGWVEGKSKIEIARRVLTQIIRELPDGIQVGLRAYGHRYGRKDRRACKDTELVAPIRPLVRGKLIGTINSIQPRGRTPLVYSVLQAPNDFEEKDTGTLILLTDGIESCDGDIRSIGAALKEAGLKLRLHIVGFDVKGAEARRELEAIAESAGGRYHHARDAAGLRGSLTEALQLEYAVVDGQGRQVAIGSVGGDPIQVLEGEYTLRLMVEPGPLETSVTVRPEKTMALEVARKEGQWIISHIQP